MKSNKRRQSIVTQDMTEQFGQRSVPNVWYFRVQITSAFTMTKNKLTIYTQCFRFKLYNCICACTVLLDVFYTIFEITLSTKQSDFKFNGCRLELSNFVRCSHTRDAILNTDIPEKAYVSLQSTFRFSTLRVPVMSHNGYYV